MTGSGRGAAAVLSAAAMADYALFADRSFPAKPAPAPYALAAALPAPSGAGRPGYALAVDKHAVTAQMRRRSPPYRSIAVSAVLHLALVLFILAQRSPAERLGTEQGFREAVNISVISAADLKRLSSAPMEQEAPPSPAPAPDMPAEEAQPAPAPPGPRTQEANAAPSAEQPKMSEPREAPYDPTAFIEMEANQFSAQLNYVFKAAEARRDVQERRAAASESTRAAPNVKVMRPGATHVGKSDEFASAVIWALGATVPTGNGKWGTAIVTFVVSASGQVEDLRLAKSAGDDWLDRSALMAVRQARMPVPPAGLPVGDRRFVIEYISEPFRRR